MTVCFKTALAGLITLTMLFNGCSVLPERTAKQTFMLAGPDLTTTSGPVIPVTLRVLTPAAGSPQDGTRILVNPDGQTIQAYGGARWSKPIPALVRDHWVEGLRQGNGFKAVVSESSPATSDLSLSSDLTRFQVQYRRGQPQVIIKVDVQLLESRSRRVLAASSFLVEQSVADQPVESLVAGFGQANQTLTGQLVAWLDRVSRGFYEETGQARPLSDTESSTRK